MTVAKWEEIYLERYAKQKRTVGDDGRHIRTLSAFFGNLQLSQVTKEKVETFKQLRRSASPSKERLSAMYFATVNLLASHAETGGRRRTD